MLLAITADAAENHRACLGSRFARHPWRKESSPDPDRVPTAGMAHKLIDRIRHDIRQRLDQLLAESEKLSRALVALGPRVHATKVKVLAALSGVTR
jgi:hypothetical protein